MTASILAIMLTTAVVHPATAQDTTRANVPTLLPVRVLLDSAEQFLREGRTGHAEVFAREALAQRDRATEAEYLRALLILARGLHPDEAAITVLRDTTRYPLLRSSRGASPGEAVILDLISDGTRHLVQRSDTAQQLAWAAFDRVFAREELDLGTWHQSNASLDIQIRVLELLAGALYPPTSPDDTTTALNADGVRSYLKHIVRLDPNWTLSPLVNWRWPDGVQTPVPSLNDVFVQAVDSTFGMSARRLYEPGDDQAGASPFTLSIDSIATGPDGERIWNSRHSVIAVQSNRPATFTLTATNPDARVFVVDAITEPTDRGVLDVNLLRTGDPRIPETTLISARYMLTVTAIASDSLRVPGDSLTRCFASELAESPPLPIVSIPSGAALDTPADLTERDFRTWQMASPDATVRRWRLRLRPEARQPSGIGTALRGVALGLSAAILANVFRDGEIRRAVSADNRAVLIGGAVALSSVVAAATNRPVRNSGNVRHNAVIRAEFRDSVRSQWDAYAERIQRVTPLMRIGPPRLCNP